MRDAARAEAGFWPELESGGLAQFEDESIAPDRARAESRLTESEELELAAEFLEAGESRQLDRFLGGLIQRATRSFGGVGNPRLGRVLGGMLKSLAQGLGRGPDSTGVSAFASESEVPEEREFEAARRFVRFAVEAARRTARGPATSSPTRTARTALRAAARRHAPRLLLRLRRGPKSAVNHTIEPPAPAAAEPTVSTCDTCDEPPIRECRCDCPRHRGRRVIVINL